MLSPSVCTRLADVLLPLQKVLFLAFLVVDLVVAVFEDMVSSRISLYYVPMYFLIPCYASARHDRKYVRAVKREVKNGTMYDKGYWMPSNNGAVLVEPHHVF